MPSDSGAKISPNISGDLRVNTFLSSEQEAIKEKYRSFAAETVEPLVRGLETHSVCLKEFMQNLGQKGYLGISVPREYGGQGHPFTFCAIFAEALAYYEPGLGLSLANHYAVIEVLKKYGSETQKSRYLPLLSRGETLGTLAFSEESAGTDFRAVCATLSPEGSGWLLTGKKAWVVNGEIAGLMLVLSKTSEAESDPLALSILDCSEKPPGCGANLPRLGLRSAKVNNVEFKSAKIGGDNRIVCSKDKSDKIAAFAMDAAKVILAASAVGLTFSAMERALVYARSREQFGKNIGQFQGVQWKLADMGMEAEAARLQVYRAAWSFDSEPDKFSAYAAMCKWYAARVARFHSGEAIQVCGASGLMDEGPLEKFYRDAKAMEICLGTSESQKMQIVEALEI